MKAVKAKTIFSCTSCGYQSPKWLGRCPECGQWNTFLEEVPDIKADGILSGFNGKPVRLSNVESVTQNRFATNIAEFDRILGGGIVEGSLILVGGEPGIGKSTLLLQVCDQLGKKAVNTLYISAEESLAQIKMRSKRLGIDNENIYLLNEINLESIKLHIQKLLPKVVIIDSIQVMYNPSTASSAGSVSQVKDCAGELAVLAKAKGISTVLIGHVTKEGAIAGPKVLEHLVDTVLYFEDEKSTDLRILRAVKNRFGSTNEVGIFQMSAKGLTEVLNPSEFFMARDNTKPGCIAVPVMQGSRPLLVEVQSLVVPANFGVPARRSTGIDYNKLVILVAVLERHIGLNLAGRDVFVNIASGLRLLEPSSDLAIAMAIASSFKDKAISNNLTALGEVGLSGDVRAVSNIQARLLEAKRLGFKKAVVPNENLKNEKLKISDIEVTGVDTLKDALSFIFRH